MKKHEKGVLQKDEKKIKTNLNLRKGSEIPVPGRMKKNMTFLRGASRSRGAASAETRQRAPSMPQRARGKPHERNPTP